jgi:acyl-CoA synthetase (AMP-forming)/AMP-acid ligase II
MNLARLIASQARNRPHHPAIEHGGRVIDFRQLWRLVESAAMHLYNLGIRPGHRVGLALKDHPEHLLLHYALARLGAVLVPVDHRWTATEKLATTQAFHLRVLVIEADAPELEGVRCERFEAAWLHADSAGLAPLDEHPGQPLLISLSSATMAQPRGALVTHGQMYERFVNQWVSLGFGANERFLAVTPLYFGAGRAFAMGSLAAGATVIMDPPPHQPEALVAAINASTATVTFLVPTLLRRMLPLADAGKGLLLPRLERLLVSGAPLHPEEAHLIRERISPRLVTYYASSEAGGIAVLQPEEFDDYAHTVGRPAFRVDLETVDADGLPCPFEETGRLRYCGPGVARIFLDGEGRETATSADGWFYPGDLASLGPSGHVTLHGREHEVIIRGGIDVYPTEVEHVLLKHPAIEEAAALAWPCADLGEEIAAFVVCRGRFDSGDILAHCRRHLAPYKVPRELFALQALPKTDSGSIDKRALAATLPAR